MTFKYQAHSSHYGEVIFVLSHDEPGGARNLWEQIAGAINKRGHAISLCAIYRKDKEEKSEWRPIIKGKFSLLDIFKAIYLMCRQLKANKDFITLSAQPLANIIGSIAGFFSGAKLRVISHHTPVQTYGKLQQLLDFCVGCTPVVTNIICVSDGVRQSFNNYPSVYKRKIIVIRNALSPDVAELIKSILANKVPSSNHEKLHIVAAGRLAEQKNYPQLIDSMRHVNGAYLSILGDGPERKKLEEQVVRLGVQDIVHLKGHMSHKDTLNFMANCDVFVQPSLFEGHSVALLEAAALGLPMIVSDVPTQVEAVRLENGELCAALVPIGDSGVLAKTLNQVVNDPVFFESLKKGSALITANSGFDRLVADYEKLFSLNATGH
ncbi:glycosyltransferase [Methylophilus sp. 13]|uniref:glycosyltransferase n=1 Tax=Methylophilus sp. 13 TaxID=2781018 RepID=UPI0018906FD3|nr:glycosyltransferase [Methylophilus sp. 13]MBF5037995.1 glycosyltransferase [Methylophilus sp. 13]